MGSHVRLCRAITCRFDTAPGRALGHEVRIPPIGLQRSEARRGVRMETCPTATPRLPTSLGDLLVVADDDGLTGIYFPGHWHPPAAGAIGVEVDVRGDALFVRFGEQLREYLDGRPRSSTFRSRPAATSSRARCGRCSATSRSARRRPTASSPLRLGDRNLARRVGNAVGRNPLSILVPCHRVVGADGSLTGYAGGLERKRLLLELEGAPVVAQARLF